MNTILVPVDGSSHAMKALHIACDLAEKYNGRIALLHVIVEHRSSRDLLALKIADTFPPKLKSALQAAAKAASTDKTAGAIPKSVLENVGERILEQAAQAVQRRSIEVDIREQETGSPVEAILLTRKQTGANTIVMGCRGAGASGGSPFGSVSNAVFQRADCTCLSVK